ncbi:MAG: hypothetical protein LIP77_01165 [Planctomycetes bacterium]|nr:hypothetical protein [Planctomycetota bacterium]
MRRYLPTVLATVLGLALTAAAAEVQWQPHDIAAATARAGAEGKLVYVFVEGENCPPCDAFKASHLSDPAYVDFVNTLFVPIRAHESDPSGRAFLESLRLVHPAVPRFYIMAPDGRGLSMSIGMVEAPPMGAVDVLHQTFGHELPVNRDAAVALAGRLRSHAASQRAAGAHDPNNPFRHVGLAVLEAEAWALAGRLDEAENAWGASWAGELPSQELRALYLTFWLRWNGNRAGVLAAARDFQAASPTDPAGNMFMAMALAANGQYPEALVEGERYLAAEPDNAMMRQQVDGWRSRMGH